MKYLNVLLLAIFTDLSNNTISTIDWSKRNLNLQHKTIVHAKIQIWEWWGLECERICGVKVGLVYLLIDITRWMIENRDTFGWQLLFSHNIIL